MSSNEKEGCLIPFILLVIAGILFYCLCNANKWERESNIEKHGKVIKTEYTVIFDREYVDEPLRYYKIKVRTHEDGTRKVDYDVTQRIEISEWEYNKFMDENYELQNR